MTERTIDPRADDERFEQRLVEIHEALAAGAPPADSAHECDADLESAVQPVQNVLRLIERVRRRERPDAEADTSQNAAGITQLSGSRDALEEPPPPAVEHLPARLGRFEFLRQLGQGGGGIVLLAHDPDLKRSVALKVPRPEALMTSEARSRFLREAEAAASLNHPHIVPVFEAGTDGPLSYIVSAFCNGTSLAEWLRKQQGPLEPRTAAELTATLADAVQHAHSRGILHRDLKPANVLLETDSNGENHESEANPTLSPDELAAAARISDFGLASIEGADGGTQTGSILGTPSYMSPEQAQGDVRHVGAASDVYSLGAILYELLTGRPPFREGSILETLQAARLNEPVPPRRLRDEVPRDLEAVCLKCLEKHPECRYASAAALAEDLRSHLEGRPVAARPVGKLERGWRWCRRNPLPAALIVLVCLAMLGGMGVSTYFAIEADAKAQEAVELAEDADAARQEAVGAQQELEDELYFHRVALAEQEWKANNITRARKLLDVCPPHQRQWEWYYLRRMIETGYKTLTGHDGGVLAVAYNSDGTVLASGGEDDKVILWDGNSGQKIGELPAVGSAVKDIALHPASPHLAVAAGREIVIWDWAARREVRRWEGHPGVIFRIDYSADGKLIGSDSGESVAVWDSETGEEIGRHEKGAGGSGVRFAPEGPRLVTAGRNGPITWDYEADETSPTTEGHRYGVYDVDFNPAGDRVATVSYDGTAIIWSAETSERLVILHGQEAVSNAVRFSPDDRKIAAAGRSNVVWIWDSKTGRPLMTLRGHTSWVNDLSYHPGGEKLASAGDDGTVRIWDVVRGQQYFSSTSVRNVAFRPLDLTFSPDGRWLAMGTRDRDFLGIYDSRTFRGEFSSPGHERSVWQSVFCPDGAYFASAGDDGRVIIRNTLDWKPLLVLEHDLRSAEERRSLPENPFEPLRGLQHDPRVRGLAITKDGSRLISTAGDTVRIWSMPDGRLQSSFSHPKLTPAYAVQSIAVTPDGQTMYSAGHDAKIRVWDLSTGNLTAVLKGHSRLVHHIALDQTGRWLISGSEDLTAKLWRTADGTHVRDFTGNTEPILAVLFSRNGRRVFTISADGLIRIWDTDTARLVLTLVGGPTGRCLALSPDGHRLASSAIVGDFRIWNATPLSGDETDPLDDPRTRADLLFEAAQVDEQYTPDKAVALRGYKNAIEAYEQLRHEAPADSQVRLQLCKAQLALSNLLQTTESDPDEIRQLLDSALSVVQELVTEVPDDILYQEQMGLVCFKLGSVALEQDPAECERWLRQAIDSLGQVVSARPLAIEAGSYLRRSRWHLMEILARDGRTDEAIESGLEALALEQSLLEGREENPMLAPELPQRELLQTLLREAGRADEAANVQLLTDPIGVKQRAAESLRLGRQQRTGGDHPAAIEHFRVAVEASAVLLRGAPDDRSLQLQLARAQTELGNVLYQQPDEAVEILSSAVALLEPLVNSHPDNADYREQLGRAFHILGARYSRVDPGRREECFRQAIAHLSEAFSLQADGAGADLAWQTFRYSHWNLMNVLSAAGRVDEAIECGLKAIEIEETLDGDSALRIRNPSLSNRDLLDVLLREAGRTEEADVVRQRADELRPPEELAAVVFDRGVALISAQDYPAAIEHYRRAAGIYTDLLEQDPDNNVWRIELARDQFFNTVLAACDEPATDREPARPRLRDLEVAIGVLPTGSTNSLTDVPGVRVGHRTIVEGDSVRTGVTAILPHEGNLFQLKVPAAVHVANGFGKFVGTTQIDELGVLETPILLTNTLSTFAAADALVGWTLELPGNDQVRSVNPVVGECNDGYLNDIRQRRVTAADVELALRAAHAGPVTEGCIGAGTGTRCMGWKGGIGSSSRRLPESLGGYTVGVLVQTNFGGSLTVAGVPVGRELGRYYLKDDVQNQEHGSCIVIVATDAPLDARRLNRLARRAPLGLAAAGSPISHGSGDYVLAFSTHKDVRSSYEADGTVESVKLLRDDALSPLFQAVRDAAEEAVINSLLQARTITGHKGRTVEAIDPEQVREIRRRHGAIDAGSATVSHAGTERTYGATIDDALRDRIGRLSRSTGELMEQHNVPGVSVAVVSDRQLVWSGGFGTRCAGSGEPVLPETVLEACSMSKPFFAYLLLKLVEEGRFDLQRPLVEYLRADYLDDDPRHRLITARMVLSHTSGLPNWRKGGWRSGSPLTLSFEPGTEFQYSGEGFLMLQRAVEKHFETELDKLSRERLIEPLGLTSTRFVWDDHFVSRSACGHDGDGNAKTGRRYYDRANAAYTLYTSAEDYARFLVEILGTDRTARHSLSREMVSRMLSPVSHRDDQTADWGLGWGLRDTDGALQVYHSGSNGTGFRCYSEFFPSTGDGLVIMTNAVGGKSLWKALVEEWHTEGL